MARNGGLGDHHFVHEYHMIAIIYCTLYSLPHLRHLESYFPLLNITEYHSDFDLLLTNLMLLVDMRQHLRGQLLIREPLHKIKASFLQRHASLPAKCSICNNILYVIVQELCHTKFCFPLYNALDFIF